MRRVFSYLSRDSILSWVQTLSFLAFCWAFNLFLGADCYWPHALWESHLSDTPPKFNIARQKWCLEDYPFLLGPGSFSGAMLLNFQGKNTLKFWRRIPGLRNGGMPIPKTTRGVPSGKKDLGIIQHPMVELKDVRSGKCWNFNPPRP